MLTAWADHEHFILGISESNQYAIGIAGAYSKEHENHAQRLGFTQFVGLKKDPPRTGDNGYWLMIVDI